MGSIPTSIILGKKFKGIDVREHGSKNPGATNAYRVLGAKLGIAVLILDMMKGFLPLLLAYIIGIFLDLKITAKQVQETAQCAIVVLMNASIVSFALKLFSVTIT